LPISARKESDFIKLTLPPLLLTLYRHAPLILKHDIYRPEVPRQNLLGLSIHTLKKKMKGRRENRSFLGMSTSGRWVGTRKGGMRVSIYENSKMNPAEIALRRGKGKEGEPWRG
jgi:hypothetical protein